MLDYDRDKAGAFGEFIDETHGGGQTYSLFMSDYPAFLQHVTNLKAEPGTMVVRILRCGIHPKMIDLDEHLLELFKYTILKPTDPLPPASSS